MALLEISDDLAAKLDALAANRGLSSINHVLDMLLSAGESISNANSDKSAEEALRASEARYQALFEQTNDGVFIFDLNLIHRQVNQQAADMLGYSVEEIVGQHIAAFMMTDELDDMENRRARMFAGETLPIYERHMRHKDGRIITVEVNAALVRDNSGQPSHYHSVIRDVTERKQLESELHVSRNRMRAIIDAIPDLILRFDAAGVCIEHIPTQASITPFSYAETLVGQPIELLADSETALTIQTAIRLTLKTGDLHTSVYQRHGESGTIIHEEARLIPEDSNTVLAIIRNITAWKTAELALIDSERDAREFQDHLKVMVRLNTQLSACSSETVLLREAIELGAALFDFDRLNVFLFDATAENLVGTFGINQQGQLRVEHNVQRASTAFETDWDRVLTSLELVYLWPDVDLTDRDNVVGHGWYALAAISYGESFIGAIAADNLLRQRPPRSYETELLALYATTLGNLIVLRRTADQLQHSERTAREFQQYLKILHEINLQLARAETLDDLCREAVELGVQRLDLGRMGLFLIRNGNLLCGTYGTAPDGSIRPEHDYVLPLSETGRAWQTVLEGPETIIIGHDAPLLEFGQPIGQGWHSLAAMGTEDNLIGGIATDNLTRQQPPRSYEAELITLYSAMLGHLIARKQTEEQLRHSEATARDFQGYLKVLHETHLELAHMTSLDDICRRAVEIGLLRLGYDRMALFLIDEELEELQGTWGTDLAGNLRDEHPYRQSLAAQDQWPGEVLTQPDRTLIWEKSRIRDFDEVIDSGWRGTTALRDADQIVGYFAVDNLIHQRPTRPFERELLSLYGSTVGNVIARLRHEKSLQASEVRFRTLMEAAPLAILLVDTDGQVVQVNQQAAAMFGYRQNELLNLSLETLMPDQFRSRHRQHRAKFFERPKTRPNEMGTGLELQGRRHDGTEFPITAALSSIETDDGTLALAYVMDDTLREEAQQQKNKLQLAQERAELVASFIRDTAHEFRTPLSVIQTSLYLLNRLAPSEKTAELSQKIQVQADSILKLVEALTTMTRLDSESQDEFNPVNLNVVLRNALDQFQGALTAKQLALTLDVVEPVTIIMGDASELALAFSAMIENAIRYTAPKGAITITTAVEADLVKITIRDNGQGMTPAVLAQAFDRFFRADEAHSTRGFGLGLPIARKIVENHQGSVTAESEPGAGSTFTVTLPVKKKT